MHVTVLAARLPAEMPSCAPLMWPQEPPDSNILLTPYTLTGCVTCMFTGDDGASAAGCHLERGDVRVLVHQRQQAVVGVLAAAQLHAPVDLPASARWGAAGRSTVTLLVTHIQSRC